MLALLFTLFVVGVYSTTYGKSNVYCGSRSCEGDFRVENGPTLGCARVCNPCNPNLCAVEKWTQDQSVFYNEIFLTGDCSGAPLIRNEFVCGQCTAVALAGISILPFCSA